ncbi:MAG: VanZ family protein [Thermoleophilia bacterium]|nr:VanZ family protein [Thermoleophilia bacterium]
MIFWFSNQPDLRVSSDDLVDFVVRKAAHMLVFGVLALLCALLLGSWMRTATRMWIAAWLLTLAFAISDEWHQTFVHGRVGHAQDVAIDMVGASVALLVAGTRLRSRATRAANLTAPPSEEPHR